MFIDVQNLQPATGLGLLVAILVFAKLASVIHTAYFSPLAKVPGPALAKVTDLWLLWQLYSYRKCPALEDCFRKYGSIVRIGPNKLAVNSEESMKICYGIGTKFTKSQWYKSFAFLGWNSVFTLLENREHAERKRITARLTSKTSVMEHLPEINEHIKGFLNLMHQRANQVVDIMCVYRFLALDIVGSTTFGRGFGLMKTGLSHPFIDDLDAVVMTFPPRGYLSKWVWAVAKRIPNKQWQHHIAGEGRLCSHSNVVIDEQLEYARTHGGKLSPEYLKTIVGAYIDHRDAKGQPLPRGCITSDIATVYFAGTDTTSISLSFLTWELARKKDLQKTLYDEVRAHIPDPSQVPALTDAETWPYLNAIIKEALRLYPAAPSHLERVVPPGGATVEGKWLPPGTVIGVQAYSIQRKPEVFPEPELFKPERWFNETDSMKRCLMPFGLGARACPGMHISYMEMRLVVAMLVRNFEIGLSPLYDPKDMEVKDFWLLFPAAKKCEVVLKPRESLS